MTSRPTNGSGVSHGGPDTKDKGVLLPNHHFSSGALPLRKHHEDMPALQFVDAVETRWFPRRPAAHTRPLHLFSLSSPRRASFPSVHLLATRAAPSAPMWVVEARQRASPDLLGRRLPPGCVVVGQRGGRRNGGGGGSKCQSTPGGDLLGTPGTRLTSSSFPAVFFSGRCTSLSSVLSLSLLPFLHSSSSSISRPPSPSRPPLLPRLQLAARFATRCAPARAVAAPLLLLSLDRGRSPRLELLPGLPFSFPSPTGSLSPFPVLPWCR